MTSLSEDVLRRYDARAVQRGDLAFVCDAPHPARWNDLLLGED